MTRSLLPLLLLVTAACTPERETATDCLGKPVAVSPPNGTALLTWDAPLTRTDGSPIDDLSGYKIYYGVEPGELSCQIEIRDPKSTAWTVTGLSPGTWYFAVVSLDSAQVESELSSIASKRID